MEMTYVRCLSNVVINVVGVYVHALGLLKVDTGCTTKDLPGEAMVVS